jgi:septal ring-binding cell division protein DamX
MSLRNRVISGALYLLIIATMFGCARNKPPEPVLGVPEKEHNPWFCQTGEETDRWDCVQDEALSKNPRITRSPPPAAAGSDKAAPSFRRGRQPPIQRKPSTAAPAPQTAAARPPTPGISTADRPQDTQKPKPSTTANTMPKHIRLAYRPEKTVNLVDLPAEFWAVQLIALSSKDALEAYANELDARGMSAAEIAVNGKLFYVLLLGIYETKAIAQEAITELEPNSQKPWVRTVGSLQAVMLAANQINEQH